MKKIGETFAFEKVKKELTKFKPLAMTKIAEILIFGKFPFYINELALRRLLVLSFGILRAKTVNMSSVNEEILLCESGRKSKSSQYNYLLNIFQSGNSEKLLMSIFNFLVVLFHSPGSEVKVLLDRTEWKVEGCWVNVFSIGLLYKDKVYIPLLNEDLGRKGSSDAEIRIDLIDRFTIYWSNIELALPQFIIVGDREFIGQQWLCALAQRGMDYVIRIKSNLSFEVYLNGIYKIGKRFKLKVLHRYLKRYNKRSIEVVLAGETISNIVAIELKQKKEKKDQYLYLITNIKDLNTAGAIYKTRWKIETCFAYLKSKGFNLEDSKLAGQHKYDILMAILALVYALVIFQGEREESKKKKRQIQYQNGKVYPRVSLFKKGRERLAKIRTLKKFAQYFFKVTKIVLNKWLKKYQVHILNLSG